jgi:hypothetical protein
MLKRLLIGVTLAGLSILIVQAIPDLKRYMKIRKM